MSCTACSIRAFVMSDETGPASRRGRRMLLLWIGLAIVVVTAVGAVLGPALTPFDPSSQELSLRLARPSPGHPFGLDELGRDILARVLAGARISFAVGLTVVSV